MTTKTKRIGLLLVVSALVFGGVACKSSNEASPSDDGGSATAGKGGGSGGKAGGGGGGNGGTSGGNQGGSGGGNQGGTSGGQAGTGGGQAGTGGGGPCGSQNGSFAGTPKTDKQFLNHCTNSQCEPFDDEARLPLFNHGNLPAVP